ncbi:MAG: glutamyl-tRNA reductase, partial [Chloroflexi bacterium]
LSQVRTAFEFAAQHDACGIILSALFRHALHAGKRARSETDIARGATSLSSLAIEAARAHLGVLDRCRALIIRAGKMSTLAARRLHQLGMRELLVWSRTLAHAQQLAAAIDGSAIPFERVPEVLAASDVVFTSTSAPHVILTHEILDLAVPHDVEPTVAHIPHVHLLDLNDLQTNATAHVAARRAEVCAVQGIVGEEVESFSRWLQSLNVTPTIRALRARADQIRRSELDDHLGRLHQLSEHDRRIIETMTASIVGRLLHDPTRRLKQCAGDSDGLQYAAALRKLFALDEEPDAA